MQGMISALASPAYSKILEMHRDRAGADKRRGELVFEMNVKPSDLSITEHEVL